MRKILIALTMLVCLGVGSRATAQCTDVPVINSFAPNTGFIGSVVEIFGANFDPNNVNNNVVYFGATKAQVISATFGKLEVIVPIGASTAPISVTNQCDLTAYSRVPFNGIFCPTPLDAQTYDNRAFDLTGVAGAYNMLSQDMDLDGKPEVISAGRQISVAINNSTPGNLNFSAYNFNPGGFSTSIYIADFDGDGLKDIVTPQAVIQNTSTGPGNFSLNVVTNSQGVSSYQIAAGDFNNDGKIDIIGENGNRAWVAFNTSTGPGNFSFTPRQDAGFIGSRCTGIQVADIDGDGKTDFIASQGGANRAVTLRNTTPNGSMTVSMEPAEYWASNGSFPYRSQVADFDKDGKIDFTSCNFSGATNTAIWRNTSTVGDISFATTVNLPAPGSNYRIQVGDVDGDGYPDIVTKSLGVKVFAVYRNSTTSPGNITFEPRIDYTNAPFQAEVSGIVIGDLDGDFVPDIATSGISSNRILFHRNTSSQQDLDPPRAVCQDITVALDPTGNVSITPEMVDNGSSDACGIDNITLSQLDFTCNDIGANTVTLTVTDNAGNTTTCTATVNVQPAAIIVTGQTTVCEGETIPLEANDGDSYQWFKDGQPIPGANSQTYVASETGSYTVDVTNGGGCSGTSLPVDLTVNDNPTVDIFPKGTAYICPNGSATLTANQSALYQWYKDGAPIPNATQQVYEATTPGDYSVEVIDLFGCSAVSPTVFVTSDPPILGLTEGGNNVNDGDLLDYGDVFPNSDNTKTLTITNTGANALFVSDILISGPDAQYFTPGLVQEFDVPAGGSVDLDIVFNAPNTDTYSASLTLLSNDCDRPTINLDLAAEITCPLITVDVTPYGLDCFGYDYQLTIIPNGGTAPYTVTATGGTPSNADPNVFLFSGFNTATNTVTIEAVDANGCSSGAIAYELTNPELVVPGTVEVVNASCANSFDGSATYSGQSGGTPHVGNDDFPTGWSYFLFDENGNEFTQGDPTFTNLGPGNYAIGANDANGCGTGLLNFVILNTDDQAPEIFPPGSFTETGSGPDCGLNIVLPNPDIVENCAVTELSVYVNGNEAFDYVFVPQDGNIEQPRQVIFGPDGHLYVSNLVVVGPGDFEGQVLKYDGVTGDFIMEIGGPSGSTSIAFPRGIDFGPDGNLYVASQNSGEVLRLDPNTGGLIDIFVPAGTGGLGQPTGIVFGPDGHLYVADRTSASVRKFDGNTGASQGEFVTGGSGGLAFPIGITFGPDGNFYSTSLASNSINRYDGGSGAFIDEFVPSGSQGLDLPEDLEFGPDGNLYVSSFNGLVSKYDGQSGAFLEDISATGIDLPNAEGLTFGPDGHLYVSNLGRQQIVRYPLGPIHIPFGTNDITINATDNSGNGSSANYTIDVIDDLPPVVECQDITVVLGENGTAFVPAEDLTARTNLTSDNWLGFIGIILNGNFSGGDVVAIEDIKSNIDAENDIITLQPNFDPSYPENFDNPELQGSTYIETFGDLAGKSFEFTGHVASNTLAPQYNGFAFIRLFDANWGFLGEISSPLTSGTDFSVAYDNSEPDAWIIQYGFTVQGPSGANEDEASLGEAVVQGMRLRLPPYDNCTIATIESTQMEFDCSHAGDNIVTLTVTDVNGNATSCDATVTIVDKTPPVAVCQDITIQLDASGNAFITPDDINNGSSDACGIDFIELDRDAFGCNNVGQNQVTLTLTDIHGNSSSCTALVTVEDITAPELIAPDPLVLTGSGLDCGASLILPTPEVIESCGLSSAELLANGETLFDYTFVPAGTLQQPRQLIFGPDGNLYVGDLTFGPNGQEGRIMKFDGTTGTTLLEIGGPSGSTSLAYPRGLDFGPDGNLYVSSSSSSEVLRFDPNTGVLIDVFIPAGTGGLAAPTGLVFGPDGDLYVVDRVGSVVRKYDATTGAYLGDFVAPGAGGMVFPIGLTFGPDGNLYVASFFTNAVHRFDGTTGAFIDQFVPSGSGGLQGPEDVEFGPDGDLYVTSFSTGQLFKYDGSTGAFLQDITATGIGLFFPDGLTFGPDGHLYASNTGGDQIVRYPLGELDLPYGVNDITFNVADRSGNTASVTYTVEVEDDIPPVFDPVSDLLMPTFDKSDGRIVEYDLPTATDNCDLAGPPVLISGIGSGGFFPIGTTTEVYEVTDINGNVSTTSFVVTITTDLGIVNFDLVCADKKDKYANEDKGDYGKHKDKDDKYDKYNKCDGNVIRPLRDGDIIDAADPATSSISIVANVSRKAGSVAFYLDGELVRIDNYKEYSITGNKKDIFEFNPTLGTHTLTAIPYSKKDGEGDEGIPLTITFTVINTSAVTSFNLFETDKYGQTLPMTDGQVIDVAGGYEFTIEAVTDPAEVGSVLFLLNGEKVSIDNDNIYLLENPKKGKDDDYGKHKDKDDKREKAKPFDWTAGDYTLTAIPFEDEDMCGTSGTSATITFTIVNSEAVTSFAIVDEKKKKDDDEVLIPLEDGDIVDIDDLRSKYRAIQAFTNPDEVGSVVFYLDGEEVDTDYKAPYLTDVFEKLKCKDSKKDAAKHKGDKYDISCILGEHTLTAVPYSQKKGEGVAGTALTITFEVVQSTSTREELDSEELAELQVDAIQSVVYPNPVVDKVSLSILSPMEDGAEVAVIDLSGKVLHKQALELRRGTNEVELDLVELNVSVGTVLLKVSTHHQGTMTHRLMKQ